jgi:membrane-bound lytic murein transglycosylase F
MIRRNKKEICLTKKVTAVKRTVFLRKGTAAATLALILLSCAQREADEAVPDAAGKRERLIVATCNNSADYFVYKGQPMGFQYDVLTEFAKNRDLRIEFIAGKSYDENLKLLAEGRCDLIASGQLSPQDKLPEVDADTLYMAQQALVQRKPDKWKDMSADDVEKKMVRQPEDLNGKLVYASGWSALSGGVDFMHGRHIRFVALKGIAVGNLVELVAEGELDYAVCNLSEARLAACNYENIDIRTELGELPAGWLIGQAAADLRQDIRQWLTNFRKTAKYAVLYRKYHTGATIQRNARSKLFANHTGIISEYDEIFRKYSAEIGWDWRLLAALVYQESRFIPNLRSPKGAYGLMQIMPATLEHFGVDTTASPDRHVAAGVAYIKFLDRMIAPHVENIDERIKFILASYNIGLGHIFDARRLAEKYGKDAGVWDNNVDSCLLGKSDPRFYNDPDVLHGKCRGKETYAFVTQIMELYGHYKNIDKIQ